MSQDITIFVFIDAMGWELLSRMPFLEKELPFRRKIGMQFGYSSSAIPTILSGKAPSEHGHLGLFRFAPDASPFRRLGCLAPFLKPASFWNRGRIRHWLSKAIQHLYGFTGYFQLYQMPFEKLPFMDYCEKCDLFAPKGMAPIENLADFLLRSGCPFHISDWRIGDRRNLEAARNAIREGKNFLFVYTAELDAILHQHPVLLHDSVREKMEWYETEIRSLLQLCQAAGKRSHLTVFSDHGMTPLAGTVDLQRAVEATPLRFGIDYGACYDSTLLRVTFLSPQAEPILREAIHPFDGTYGHWLSQEEECSYGIYRKDRFFGDAIFLTNPGIQIAPSDMGQKPLPGMHGFAPEDKDSQAAILSTDAIPDDIRHVADYFRLMTSATP